MALAVSPLFVGTLPSVILPVRPGVVVAPYGNKAAPLLPRQHQ